MTGRELAAFQERRDAWSSRGRPRTSRPGWRCSSRRTCCWASSRSPTARSSTRRGRPRALRARRTAGAAGAGAADPGAAPRRPLADDGPRGPARRPARRARPAHRPGAARHPPDDSAPARIAAWEDGDSGRHPGGRDARRRSAPTKGPTWPGCRWGCGWCAGCSARVSRSPPPPPPREPACRVDAPVGRACGVLLCSLTESAPPPSPPPSTPPPSPPPLTVGPCRCVRLASDDDATTQPRTRPPASTRCGGSAATSAPPARAGDHARHRARAASGSRSRSRW